MAELAISDEADLEREWARLPPADQAYARSMIALVAAIGRELSAAEGRGTLAQKAAALERTKRGISELEECARNVPGWRLAGLDATRRRVALLEATLRAMGAYRAAGIPGMA